ncbi:MAG: hypothetical protein QGG60_02805 [Anaerolineales bacterium]|jgi:hypothetical protein|nr:hypothetical protein [Anaerolineales bacterium]MDP7643609.1 hypothetical protein [Anaerolineales bacterium]HJL70377.1 hypothetical protein [Anaerolineales bacterium]HJN41963.1 hypothetical protein [Anaerolineales bacterium]
MIRTGGWRDLSLLRRLMPRGVCLHSEAAFTTGARVMQKGLVGLFSPHRGATTLVWRGDGDEKAAFAQMQLEDGAQRARVYFIAPAGAETPLERSVALLEGLAKEAGACAARNLMAEAQEGSAEFAALRKAGFAIYARQQVYRLLSRPEGAKAGIELHSCAARDEIATQRLYSNIVPALVRHVEPTPTGTDNGFVLRRDDDVVALLSVKIGPKGVWVQPFVHPEAEGTIGEVLAAFLQLKQNDPRRPVYICARSYQSWLRGALQAAGFEPWGQQAVMVKRLTVSGKKPVRKPMPAIAATEVEISAPVAETSLIEATTPATNLE